MNIESVSDAPRLMKRFVKVTINRVLLLIQNGPLPFNKFEYVLGWFLREFSAPFLFLNALWEPTIQWRTNAYRLRWGGIAEEVKPKVKL